MIDDLIKQLTWRQVVLGAIALVALIGFFTFLSDPLMWQRYVGAAMNADDPNYMTFYPTETVGGPVVYEFPRADDATRTVSDEALRTAEAYAAEFNSYALIVIHKGAVQTEWYSEGWNRDRLTQSQSLHKTVAAVLVGAAIEDGVIKSVDDPIANYIKEWADDERGKITVRQLLIMASGLDRYEASLNPFSTAFQWRYASDTTDPLLRIALDGKPGESFDYNDVDTELLGLVIERATGKRYADYLNEKLWLPIGNMQARIWLDHKGGKAHASCCLLAPAMDWARIGTMLMNKGIIFGRRIVGEGWVDQMIAPSPLSPWYGFQIWLGAPAEARPNASPANGFQQSEPFLARDTFYAAGYGVQRVYIVPSEELVIVRLGPANGDTPIKDGWDNSRLVNTIIRGLKTRTAER